MVYDYEDSSDIPNLQEFKEGLIEDLFKSIFYQQPMDAKYNMLKLPTIISPCTLGKQVNNEAKKKTLMEKSFTYEKSTLDMFMKLVDNNEVILNRIPELKTKELTRLNKKLGIFTDKKTGELMRIDLLNLSKILLGGQVQLKDLHGPRPLP